MADTIVRLSLTRYLPWMGWWAVPGNEVYLGGRGEPP